MLQKTISFRERLVGIRLARVSDTVADKSQPDAPRQSHSTQILPPETATHTDDPLVRRENERAEIEQVLAAINEAVMEMEQRRRTSLGELQELAVELAVAVASKVVHETIQTNEFPIEKTVEQLIERCNPRSMISVRLHPQDMALLDRRIEGKPPPWAGLSTIQFVSDTTLNRGDCQVDTEEHGFVSRIDSQLSDIRQHLLESLDDAQIERRKAPQRDHSLQRFPDRRETA